MKKISSITKKRKLSSVKSTIRKKQVRDCELSERELLDIKKAVVSESMKVIRPFLDRIQFRLDLIKEKEKMLKGDNFDCSQKVSTKFIKSIEEKIINNLNDYQKYTAS